MKWLLVLLPAILCAQVVELGPAPLAPEEFVKPGAKAISGERDAGGGWYDTAARETVRTLYNTTYAPTDSVSTGWTGAVAGCIAGTTSQTWRDAVAARINWFRGMAGVPTGVVLNDSWNTQTQQAALMMSANRTLSHSPTQATMPTCFAQAGADAAGKSNLCYRWNSATDAGCVAGYVADTGGNNTAAGHRRWVLYPQTTTMGSGDVAQTGSYPSGYPFANALYVIDSGTYSNPRPATRDGYVAWPPKGYVPYQAVYERWSFAYPGANFSAATVTMTRDGSPVAVTQETVQNGYGENTLVWKYDSMPGGAPANDSTVSVTIGGITGAPQTSYTYQVILFDPATSGGGPALTPVTVTTNPSGLAIVVDGTNYTSPRSFNWTPASQHTVNATSPQQTSGTRYLYANWSQGGAASQTVTTPGSSTTYTANYTTQYLLTTSVSPAGAGTIGASPSSADGYYTSGTQVQLTASATGGNSFTNWSGALSGSANPQTLAMSTPRSVSAAFSLPACGSNYVLSPQNWVVAAGGGLFTVNVSTGSGCSWSATLAAGFVNPFLSVTGAGSGIGAGSFQFFVQANATALPRTGTINVMGQLVQVLQHGTNVVQVFNDVPPAHLFFDYITLLQVNGTTNGCGGGNYCPESTTSRGQMAELVIRSKLGDTFSFQAAPFFTDVPADHPLFKYIQKMKELGITDGCTASTYCPSNPVNRGEMAVFLIRGKLGVLTSQQFSYNPAPYFADVPVNHLFFAWIQKMKELGITSGCTANTYCGYDPNTLGQIAVFLTRSFFTP